MLTREEVPESTFRPGAYDGGYFEVLLAVESTDPSAARAALVALWSHPDLFGPLAWPSLDALPLPAETAPLADKLHGAARIPGGHVVACASYGSDPAPAERIWRGFGIGMASMPREYGVGGSPFEDGRPDWIVPLSEWFRVLAERVHAVAPLAAAAIGHELPEDPPERRSDVPAWRWSGYLVREGSRLTWFPPTIFRAHWSPRG